LRHFQHPLHLAGRQREFLGNLLRRGLASPVLLQLLGDLVDLANAVTEVYRKPDHAPLISQCACDGLAYPPRRVRAETMTASIVELLDGFDQAKIALLNEVQEWDPLTQVTLRDAHHQARVRANEVRARPLPTIHDLLQGIALVLGQVHSRLESLGSRVSFLQLACQRHFLLRSKQRHPRHFFQVQADRIIARNLAQVEGRVSNRLQRGGRWCLRLLFLGLFGGFFVTCWALIFPIEHLNTLFTQEDEEVLQLIEVVLGVWESAHNVIQGQETL